MYKRRLLALGWAAVLIASTLAAAAAEAAPILTLQLQATKAFRFSWTSQPGTTHYRLLEDPTGSSGFTQVGANLPATATSFDHIVPLYRRVSARYIVQACNPFDCVDSNTVHASAPLTEAIGYFKAANIDEFDRFGWAVALSASGTTLAVGVPKDDSRSIGVGGDPHDEVSSFDEFGAVYVFAREGSGSTWVLQAFIKASNPDEFDRFGSALALSADGSTLAVGTHLEDSRATGVNGDQLDNSAEESGAVYVFRRAGSVWTQQAYVKASDTGAGDLFGMSVALSGDGTVLAVGAPDADSGADGGLCQDSSCSDGAVYVFARSGSTWSQQAHIEESTTGANDLFGHAVDLSNDGSTLAVGAPLENSRATGVNGDELDNSATDSGAVYVYARLGSVWSRQAYIKASNTGIGDTFGAAVALSANGAVLAVGAPREDGPFANFLNAPDAGAVYVFGRAGSRWTQQARIKASNAATSDFFGGEVELSNDGATLAVAAIGESSAAVGIGGDETSDARLSSGAAYVFGKNNGLWTQRAYVKASNTHTGAVFGWSLALAGNGGTLAVGAYREEGTATGINGPQQINFPGPRDAGAVYLY